MVDDSTRVKVPHSRPRESDELPCLEIVRGRDQGRIVWLEDTGIVLGRAEELDVSLPDDGVSRRHAKVILSEDGIVNLKDLGSTNGTWVNGAPIDATLLREGDRIQLGPDVTLRFGYRSKSAEPIQAPQRFVLSARELEIAELVAQGLTNPQIGKRLHISRHTVVSHLSNIYERTGINTRTALAGLVAQGRVVGRQ